MPTFVTVFALVLAYLALVGVYFAMRSLARLRRTVAQQGRNAAASTAPPEQVPAVRAEAPAPDGRSEPSSQLAAALQSIRAELESVQRTQAGYAERQGLDLELLQRQRADVDGALRNTALVRYDAFEDVSGRMSFSLALLDADGNGLTLSALAARTDTRVYAKSISAGKGQQELSPEEQQAVRAALGSSRRAPQRKSA